MSYRPQRLEVQYVEACGVRITSAVIVSLLSLPEVGDRSSTLQVLRRSELEKQNLCVHEQELTAI